MDGQLDSRDQMLMARYLLGDLSDAEKERVEERFFDDKNFFEQLLAVEDELVDDYARGTLPASERQRFEQHWLVSSERRGRVHMATQLVGLLRARSAANRSSPPVQKTVGLPIWRQFRWSLAAAAVIVAVGGAWLVPQLFRARNEVIELRRERAGFDREREQLQRQLEGERARSTSLTEQLRQERETRASSRNDTARQSPIVAFVLPPGLTRSDADRNRLLVARGIGGVRFQVDVPPSAAYRRYRALVQTPEAENVWSQDVLAPTAADRSVFVTVPSSVLPDGDYILTVQGVLPTGGVLDVTSGAFRIVRP